MYEKLNAYLLSKGLAMDDAKQATRLAIHDYLKQAITDNKAYLAIPDPLAADRNAQVTKLTRQLIRVERLLLNDLTAQE